MYNFDEASSHMDSDPLNDADALNFVRALECAGWKREEGGITLAAWLALAPISGALDWRPHIWLTGPSGTGKSWIMDHVCNRILHGYATFTQGQSTEAGLRQNQRSRSLPIIFDEFETNDPYSAQRIKSILELARQASSDSAAVVLKGSSGGDAVQYRPRFSIMVSSVRINLVHEEDMNRFTLLEIDRQADNSKFDDLEAWVAQMPKDFGSKLARRSFEQLPVIISNSRVFQKIIGKKYSMRFGQQWGALAAGLSSLIKPGHIFTEVDGETFIENGLVRHGVFDRALVSSDERDENKALDYLLHSSIDVDNLGTKEKMVVLEAIRHTQVDRDFSDELERLGIKVEGANVYIINNHEPIKKLYSRTKWSGSYSKAISRIADAENNQSKWFKSHKRTYRCVKVNLPILNEIL